MSYLKNYIFKLPNELQTNTVYEQLVFKMLYAYLFAPTHCICEPRGYLYFYVPYYEM